MAACVLMVRIYDMIVFPAVRVSITLESLANTGLWLVRAVPLQMLDRRCSVNISTASTMRGG